MSGAMAVDVLARLLRGEPALAAASVPEWWAAQREVARLARTTWETAALGGARADRLGWAFAAGYEAALSALLPDRDRARTAALCATEAGGAHPRAIATTWRDGALRGEKTFVTLGPHADDLLVLADAGGAGAGDAGRRALVLVCIPRDARGVVLTELPPMPFVSEIPHASVRFEDAEGGQVAAGDGWNDYVRPFRTVEDVHVHTAVLAFLVSSGRRWSWPAAPLERAAALLIALAGLTEADPGAPATHLALAGLIADARALIADLEPAWASSPPEDAARWARDRPLLDIAQRARAARTARAWEALEP